MDSLEIPKIDDFEKWYVVELQQGVLDSVLGVDPESKAIVFANQ